MQHPFLCLVRFVSITAQRDQLRSVTNRNRRTMQGKSESYTLKRGVVDCTALKYRPILYNLIMLYYNKHYLRRNERRETKDLHFYQKFPMKYPLWSTFTTIYPGAFCGAYYQGQREGGGFISRNLASASAMLSVCCCG